jgi:hypothetical protein
MQPVRPFLNRVRQNIDANIHPEYQRAQDEILAQSSQKYATYDTEFRVCDGLARSVVQYVKEQLEKDGCIVKMVETSGEDYGDPGERYLQVKVPRVNIQRDTGYETAYDK